ncbi:MAG: transposase [Planctomycetes bacterium RIFOXYB12_FULL_42_10]|nr:MAG: transposase [Planctomycetes bacterium RIFOXYB12_FULL_42_10]
MSRFKKLTHCLWHCKYHIVWVPKYRFRVLTGQVKEEVCTSVQTFSSQKGCEILELNVQADHVHIVTMIPPKVSVSEYVGTVKGRSAIRVFKRFPTLKKKPYWGNHFWAQGYCVDTIGLDEEMIRKYVRYQEQQERRYEQQFFEY